jgi:hypothetical protein
VKGTRPSARDAFRRIRTPPTFACGRRLARSQVSVTAQTSRTHSPSTHRRSRQRIAASFWLARTLWLVLRLPVIMRIEMRPNRRLPPKHVLTHVSTTSTRASRTPDDASRATFASCWSGIRAFHDARFASVGLAACFVWGVFFPRFSTSRRSVPLALLSPPHFRAMPLSRASFFSWGRRDCFHRASVKITRCPQPGVPSIAR